MKLFSFPLNYFDKVFQFSYYFENISSFFSVYFVIVSSTTARNLSKCQLFDHIRGWWLITRFPWKIPGILFDLNFVDDFLVLLTVTEHLQIPKKYLSWIFPPVSSARFWLILFVNVHTPFAHKHKWQNKISIVQTAQK